MTVQVWWDGFGSALVSAVLSGVIAALVAVYVVRRQVKADRHLAQRSEDVRVAVLLMESAIRYAYGMHTAIVENAAKRDPQPPMHEPGLALWSAVAMAYCQRPDDAELRQWAVSFQKLIIQRTAEFVKNPQVGGRTELQIAWTNVCASVLASYLERGAPLGKSPADRWAALSSTSNAHG